MSKISMAVVASTGLLVVSVSIGPLLQAQAERRLDADKLAQVVGVQASTLPDGVIRVAWPRKDVVVRVGGMPLHTFAGLESWAAFRATPHGATVMGDTVVFEDEVSPAMDAAFAHNLDITALHNHFFFDEPKVYFMHIAGMGDPEKLAIGVRAVWDAIRKLRKNTPQPARRFPGNILVAGQVSIEPIEKILGYKARSQDGVVKVVIGRDGRMHGIPVGGSMGLTTWAAFSGKDEYAAVCGDFIMTANEVQPVLRALRKADIHIVALHNHMVGEEPPFYFAHFWGKGPAPMLARGIQSALEAQARASKHSPKR